MTPDAFTIQEKYLAVGDGHELYVHEWGNRAADIPIFFLHGGPGAGCNDGHKQLFDPTVQRVIFHDQRGCSKSKYSDALAANTTQTLVEDIKKIADDLHIEQCIIVGGSWGSCLALSYALTYPASVKAMVLRGIFTGSHAEIAWLDNGGYRHSYPDVWDRYLAATPTAFHDNPSAYHFKMIEAGTPEQKKQSAYAYECMEYALISLDDRFSAPDYKTYDPRNITVEMYFLKNKCFMPDNYLLDNAHTLEMPIWIVHGRYDMICPAVSAYKLSQKLPNGHLIWTVAGHSSSNRPNFDAVRNVTLQLSLG